LGAQLIQVAVLARLPEHLSVHAADGLIAEALPPGAIVVPCLMGCGLEAPYPRAGRLVESEHSRGPQVGAWSTRAVVRILVVCVDEGQTSGRACAKEPRSSPTGSGRAGGRTAVIRQARWRLVHIAPVIVEGRVQLSSGNRLQVHH